MKKQKRIKFFFFNFSLKITNVTSSQMNHVLGYILKLIYNNIEEADALWMIRIASNLNKKIKF